MKSFIREHVGKIAGVLSGWDRIRFRGTFRQLANASGMSGVLSYCSVLLKDFPRFAEERTAWPQHLDRLLYRACPALKNPLPPLFFNAYWSAEETEWATDIAFHRRGDLTELYPRLVRHAMTHRYLVSARGRLMIPILVALPQTTLDKLQPAA